ncbi:FIST signal transduction protein [Seonamhaeicola marinus]|uniref:Histidine kinase n=1 Tax=Seonamhaeicola marinus TaxID=1912246 RepID=A0A5D0I499_9FLAO|nr:FIST N-terminal domain-containing protein [Seonamhaeicola marinus]TYA78474.1 histidine kinase [Seonamhaeicola marinus]
MKIVQLRKYKGQDWQSLNTFQKLNNPLVLVFGNRFELEEPKIYKGIKNMFPKGHIVFGSTGGNVTSNSIDEDALTLTAIEFEKSTFEVRTINLNDTELNSYNAGVELVNKFPKDKLKYIFVLSDGSFVNGSELTKGMNFAAENHVLITGGLCADDNRFERTIVSYNENPKDGEIVAIGFYGDTLEVSSSTEAGWNSFGAERTVTKSIGNIVYELDKKPALDLYKVYLGDKSNMLPASAMYYPLGIKPEDGDDQTTIRSVLNVNHDYNAMIFAGEVPMNSKVQFMMTNPRDLLNASNQTAKQAVQRMINKPQLALFISSVGRKLLLDQRTVEEIEEAKNVVGGNVVFSGFYSYGEIAPYEDENMCQLHNQSVALTLISE